MIANTVKFLLFSRNKLWIILSTYNVVYLVLPVAMTESLQVIIIDTCSDLNYSSKHLIMGILCTIKLL